ncbi:hypothetical protein LINPERPRIM_LOCUS25406 [Linum perenne]
MLASNIQERTTIEEDDKSVTSPAGSGIGKSYPPAVRMSMKRFFLQKRKGRGQGTVVLPYSRPTTPALKKNQLASYSLI